ncbi:CGNR zinc finger domain-containing protein [Bacillus sp. NEB1478]|uniref:CGNR zinc finger domain-containing protein n=1 Tax=Bacillus sp. NEB1478 TaxID=3073816 RepID=UPI0028733E27|nr:CGNR zinc finger domain-containing protein [Bacillus sp. NEB1478]WNB93371.1 CGNR zinc finger domain-containing protein [Bacillus sp. NEB1478]
METSTHLVNLNILRDRICLDFTNTVGWHTGENPSEWIKSYEDVVIWSKMAGILSEEKEQLLLNKAKEFPEAASKVYNDAILIREAIFRIFRDVLTRKPCSNEDLLLLNNFCKRANQFIELGMDKDQYVYQFKETLELDSMLWVIVKSAADFLVSNEIGKLKECEGGGCGWLFLDTSRNHSRRWCSMEDCGNRAKARRHYQKKKK